MLPFNLRFLILFAMAAIAPLCAEWTLYTCMATTKGYVVGAKLNASGLARRTAPGKWEQIVPQPSVHVRRRSASERTREPLCRRRKRPHPHPTPQRSILEDPDRRGRYRTPRHHASIRKGRIIFAHSAGIRLSATAGKTWTEISSNLPHKYTEAIRADRARPGVLLAGGEDGIWRSDNSGARVAPRRRRRESLIMRIEQSPHKPCFWLAATEGAGVFSSTDCGQTFENLGRVGVDRNTYDIAFDPAAPNRIALAVWGTGVVVSEDAGKTWQTRGRSCQA